MTGRRSFRPAIPRDRIRRSRPSFCSSARFVCGRSGGGRPSPIGPTVILPHGGSGGNLLFGVGLAPVISGIPLDRGNDLVSPEEPRVLLRCRGCDSGKGWPTPSHEANRGIWPTERWTPRRSLPPSSDVQHQKRVPPVRSFTPPRCLPAWSDVQRRASAYPERRHQTRGIEHRSTRTSRAVARSTDEDATVWC
jgi:hypothetical protein